MFAVVEFNQASQTPVAADWLYDSLDDARDMAGELVAEAARIGRRERYRVYELTEVDLEEDE